MAQWDPGSIHNHVLFETRGPHSLDEALNTSMTSEMSDWRSNAFIVDCALGEINSLRYAFFLYPYYLPYML